VVDDQRFADRLAALRAAGAARQDRHALRRSDRDGAARRFLVRGTTMPIGSTW
jgi:hypothetical protein